LRERAIRFRFESNRPIAHVAQDLGIHKEGLRQWVRQAEADSGRRRDLLTDEREELKKLRKENAELRRANAKDASVYFAQELDRRAGEHALRAQIPEAGPPRARRTRAADRD
jgi:transposase